MKTTSRFITAVFSMLLMSVFMAPAIADELEDLKKKIQERAPAISKLKASGLLGETDSGYVESVKGADIGAANKKLMQAENRDRRSGYTIIAKKRNIAAEKVGQLSGVKKIESAKAGEWVKQKGAWKKK